MARTIPPLTRGLLAATLVLTLLNLALRPTASWTDTLEKPLIGVGNGVPFLAIVPGASLLYPWVFATATLVEQNLAGLAVTLPTLFYGGRYLERAWGEREFAKFIALVALVPNTATLLLYLAAYALTAKSAPLRTTVSGAIAIQAAFLVAFKQLVPEHTVAIAKGLVRMRVKHFPAIFLAANTLSALVLGTETALFLAYFGFLASWIYLRFYRRTPSLSSTATDVPSIKGDASDTFAFAHFFPEPLHTPVARFADALYNALVALGLCTPFSDDDIHAGNHHASARADAGLPTIMNPGGRAGATRAEAERRRALALKALDQRLHAARAEAPTVDSTHDHIANPEEPVDRA